MPFNGSGVFVRLYNWVSDRDNGVKILASKMDDEMDGFAAGLTSVNAHASATGNPHGTTAANIGAATTSNPTFTGTINGAILTLSGALTAASGAFSGALSAATATIASVLTVGRISITENTAQDITLASTNNPIQLGSETGRNVVLDTNDVQFRDNGAAATGRVNPLGGDLVLGASTATVTVNGTLDPNSITYSLGQIGDLVLARRTGASDVSYGVTVPGSELVPSNAGGGTSGSSLSGTWACLGYWPSASGLPDDSYTTLWRRIS